MEKLINIILYGGLDQETYKNYKKYILEQDVNNLFYYLIISGITFFILSIVSMITSGFAHNNSKIYFFTAAAFFLLLLLQTIVKSSLGVYHAIHSWIISLFMAVLFSESIMITLMHKSLPAVTYIGVLLMLPLLFAQCPLHLMGLQSVFVTIFCVSVKVYKPAEIASVDIWNGISFLLISIIAIAVVIPIRINNIVQNEKILELSEKDLLTGLKNRNSYEKDSHSIAKMTEKPCCIYADVNGLHELNNTRGHEAGDIMLKTVASMMKEQFGEQYSYRIGGDEFVSFTFQMNQKEATAIINEMNQRLDQYGYHVSFGIAQPEMAGESIAKIITRAESQMYEAKRAYYQTINCDRRTIR